MRRRRGIKDKGKGKGKKKKKNKKAQISLPSLPNYFWELLGGNRRKEHTQAVSARNLQVFGNAAALSTH